MSHKPSNPQVLYYVEPDGESFWWSFDRPQRSRAYLSLREAMAYAESLDVDAEVWVIPCRCIV